MKTIEIKLYKFNELSEEAQERAINSLSDINVDSDWWDSTYEDAKNIGLKLKYFGLDRNKHAEGEFIESALDCAFKIKQEHGDMTETYKSAANFIEEYNAMFVKYEDKDKPQHVAEEHTDAFDDELDEMSDEFLKTILEDYANILQGESEYLQSDEAIKETIEANDYDFTEDGKQY